MSTTYRTLRNIEGVALNAIEDSGANFYAVLERIAEMARAELDKTPLAQMVKNDAEHCAQLEHACLSEAQRKVIAGPPRWELDPPQRESYETAVDYVTALGDYADRVIATDRPTP